MATRECTTFEETQKLNPTLIIVPEEYKDIKGYEGLYRISNYGNVFDIRRNTLKRQFNSPDLEYWQVELSNHGQKTFLVHRLVASHFLSTDASRPEVNHIDGNKANEYVGNLEWCTHDENIKHAVLTGLKPKEFEILKFQKPVKILETGECFRSQFECAEKLNIPESTVGYCKGTRSAKYGITIVDISKEEYADYLKNPVVVDSTTYSDLASNSKIKRTSKCVCIVEHNMYFECYRDCERYLNLREGCVSEDILIRNGRNVKYNIHFKPVSENEYLANKDNPCTLTPLRSSYIQKSGEGRHVYCVELDKTFNSMKECDNYFGFAENTVSYKLKQYNGYFKKYNLHFKLVDD